MKKKTIAREVEAVAVLIQKLRRLEEADEYGMCVCVTCGVRRKWNKDMQGGHFISRNNKSVKLVEWQIHPQCAGCNHFKMKDSATVLRYRGYMVKHYGENKVAWLEREASKTRKYTRGELQLLKDDVNERIRFRLISLGGEQ